MIMKKITQLLMVFIAPVAFGQATHLINAQAMAWTPNDLTIDVGDSVSWINNAGSHNLNGTTATFPGNPESFSRMTVGTNWQFGKRFTIPGVYLYQCDPHAPGMSGKVTVVDPGLGVDKNTALHVVFGPNPATDVITVQAEASELDVVIYDMAGNQVLSKNLVNQKEFNVASLKAGVYVLEIRSNGSVFQDRFVKN
ncbi:Plastocyanin precursor [compost metagenome]